VRELDAEEGEEAGIEHNLVREGLATLQRLVGEPGFGASVAMLRAGLEHHVEEEEQEVFPMLRQAEGDRGNGSSEGSRNDARRSSRPTRSGGGRSRRGTGDGADAQSKAELYEEAKRLGIEGRASMSKDELAEAVRTAS
jgi:hypothetical protein